MLSLDLHPCSLLLPCSLSPPPTPRQSNWQLSGKVQTKVEHHIILSRPFRLDLAIHHTQRSTTTFLNAKRKKTETSTSREMKVRTNFQSRNFSAKVWGASRQPLQVQNLQSSPWANCLLCTLCNPLLFFDDEIFVKFRFSFDPLIEASRSHVG